MSQKRLSRRPQLSPKQREMLARAAAGEDRQIPERCYYARSGRLEGVRPVQRWYVPPGLLVPSGSAEYRAARALAAKGLLKPGSVSPSPELPYGQGGYVVTEEGWKFLVEAAP